MYFEMFILRALRSVNCIDELNYVYGPKHKTHTPYKIQLIVRYLYIMLESMK